ncbi:MAG: hypothetical protein ABI591_24005 [Kofleriaceae bacterium]
MNKLILLAALASCALVACSGDDGMQMCGADHCGLQGHTIVKWMFDAYPEWQFPMDSCVDFGVIKVRVDAQSDATGLITTASDDCGSSQVTFDGLAEGTYTLFVDPEDINGASVVNGPTVLTGVTAGAFGADTTATANIPYTSWVGTFSGTYLFRLSWGTQTCSTAVPPVVTQTVLLAVGGVPITAMTDDGQKLDGTDQKPCYELTQNFPQTAENLPFGPATLTINGYSAASTTVPAFTSTIDTFIGAGITNPTITYDAAAAM